jgi:hypothetical protein
MRGDARLVVAVMLVVVARAGAVQDPGESLDQVLARTSAYVGGYEQAFSLLVAEERYVQEIRRPETTGAGGNLSQRNPAGGFSTGGGVRSRRVLRSDYLLIRLGGGGGWMPFRDVFEVDGRAVADRNDRLAKLFLTPSQSSFDQASRIMADSTRHNLGTLTRTVNIPTLALMFLHAEIRPRFDFERQDVATINGRAAWQVGYRERARPTLIRTTGGRDLVLTGSLWVDPRTGVVLKTAMIAADPAVRAVVTTSYREDAAVGLWVPDQMEDYYKAARDSDEIFGVATYSNVRRFSVSTDEVLRKPPPG